MRKKTEAKRQMILKTAGEVFREMGYEKSSMKIIAAQIGGSKATLYNYFPSKQAIFQEVMKIAAAENKAETASYLDDMTKSLVASGQHQFEAVFDGLQEPGQDIRTLLIQFGERFMRLICSDAFIDIYRLAVAETGRSSIGTVFYENGPKIGHARIAAFLETIMQRGQLRNAPSDVAAFHLVALLKSEIHEPTLFQSLGSLTDDGEGQTAFQSKVIRAIDAFLKIYSGQQ